MTGIYMWLALGTRASAPSRARVKGCLPRPPPPLIFAPGPSARGFPRRGPRATICWAQVARELCENKQPVAVPGSLAPEVAMSDAFLDERSDCRQCRPAYRRLRTHAAGY